MTFYLLQNRILFPEESGFLLFVIGVLFILSLYHFFLYFQHKETQYLLYSAYAFFIILSQIRFIDSGFLNYISAPLRSLGRFSSLYTEAYYIIYIVFAFVFLDVKSQFPKWTRYCLNAVYGLIAYCLIKFLMFLISGDFLLYTQGYYLFTAMVSILTVIAIILFIRLKNNLKYYIIIGGFVLAICSYSSLFYYLWLIDNGEATDKAFYILYIGFILENILFSLGLGHKQKVILEERNISRKELMDQLEENHKLRLKIQQDFERDVEVLKQKVEEDRLYNLKLMYKKELAELKMEALRNQMNPHFIFNSLNSIKSYIIDNEKQNAIFYLNKFSKLVRKILSSSMESEVLLSDEIETAELYANIENIRFNNELDISIEIDKETNIDTIKVPSLILQPFIENSIWHGLSPKKGEKKLIIIVKKQEDEFVEIQIIDNGVGLARSAEIKGKKLHKRKSVGIKITKERLINYSKRFNNKSELSINDRTNKEGESEGAIVRIKIPIK